MPTATQEISHRAPLPALVACMSGALTPLIVSRPFGGASAVIHVACVTAALFALLAGVALLFRKRAPLLRVDEASLTVFGSGAPQPHRFSLADITWIALDPRPDFWRNALRLTVYTDGVPHDLWIARLPARELASLEGLLRQTFGTRYQHRAAR